MLEFHERYHPLTSRPFLCGDSYTEYRPCSILRPYIACYWNAKMGGDEGKRDTYKIKNVEIGETLKESGENINSRVLVIPDTCMDILIHINHTKQTISGYLCSIQDKPFFSCDREAGDEVSTFAVRFYFWAAHLFLNLSYKEIHNQNVALHDLGREWEVLFAPFHELTGAEEKINRVEPFLLKKLQEISLNDNLFNSFHQIISGNGRKTVKEICEYSCVSQRQLQRQFLQAVGLPMKRVANMVRYQNVWRDMILSGQFDIQDAVYRYGYTDQSHLLKEFKRFHGTTPEEAKLIAYRSQEQSNL